MEQHPNILFIYTDEQAFNTLKVYGNSSIHMPNLNGLAEVSCVVERAYVTQPVCTPSRSTLFTGQWPHTNGCTENNRSLPESTRCLPEMLPAEYTTAHIGKWHLGDELFKQHGFDEWVSIDDGYNEFFSPGRDKTVRSDYHRFLLEKGYNPDKDGSFSRGFCARLPEAHTKAAFVADMGAAFIRRQKDGPFALCVNFFEPHMPYFGPRDSEHSDEELILPETLSLPPRENQPLKTAAYSEAYREMGHSGYPLTADDDWREQIRRYWGLCAMVDAQCKKILDALKETGAWDSTLIVFTSDHGDMMGAHRLTAKCVQFEEAVRVPLLMKLPGQKEQKLLKGSMSHIDLLPTILEAVKVPLDPQLQGESRYPAFSDPADRPLNEPVFIEWQGYNTGIIGESSDTITVPSAMKPEISKETLSAHIADTVRTVITPDGFKYNRSFLTGPGNEDELYNLTEDPNETENLIGLPEYKETVAHCRNLIRDWMKKAAG